MPQFYKQLVVALLPVRGRLLHHFDKHRGERRRTLGPNLPQIHNRRAHMLHHDRERAVCGIRGGPCDHVEEGTSEAVNIGADSDFLRALRLFGTDVIRCAHGRAGHGEALFLRCAFGQTQISQLHLTVHRKENIVGLDIPVDKARLAPSVLQACCDVHAYRKRFLSREARLTFHPRLHGFTLHVLHGKPVDAVCLTRRIHLHQIWVIKSRGGDRFVVKTLNVLGLGCERGLQSLDRHQPPKIRLPRLVNRAHASLAKEF